MHIYTSWGGQKEMIVTAGPSNEGWLSAHGIVPVKAVHLMADEVWLANGSGLPEIRCFNV
jgi:hypothetical protein